MDELEIQYGLADRGTVLEYPGGFRSALEFTYNATTEEAQVFIQDRAREGARVHVILEDGVANKEKGEAKWYIEREIARVKRETEDVEEDN